MNPIFSRTRSLVFGLTLPLRALALILTSPTLMLWSAIPVIITLVLYAFVISWVQTAARQWIFAFLAAHGVSLAGFMGWLVSVLAWIILLLVFALTFSFVASIAASPFNDFLAEKTETRATPPLPQAPRLGLRAKLRLLLIDLMKTVAASLMSLLALIFSWVPGLNVVAFGVAFLLVTFQFITYPQTRRGESIGEGVAFLRRHIFACLGFGASSSLFFAFPIISSLYLPLAVVGGTLLYARASASASLLFPPLR